MVSVGKVLVLWFWKSLLIRRRNWLMTLLEIGVAVLCFYFLHFMNETLVRPDEHNPDITKMVEIAPYPRKVSTVHLAYTPSNNETDRLMEDVKKCILPKEQQQNITRCVKFQSTTNIEDWLHSQTINEIDSVAVIFDKIDLDKNLFQYTIRTNSIPGISTKLMKDMFKTVLNSYNETDFLPVQACVDTSILQQLKVLPFQNALIISLGSLPNGPVLYNFIMTLMLNLMLILSTVLLVASVLTDVIQEKASGIKEMMKMMGISSWLIWIQYLVYNLLLYIPLTLVIALSLAFFEPTFLKVSFVIVWLLLVLFIINTVFLLFFVSCFFKNHRFASGLIIVLWFLINMYTCTKWVAFDFAFTFQIIICLFLPFTNIAWALGTIASFESYVGYFHFSSILSVGYSGSEITIGVSMLLFIGSSILLFLMTLYVDAVRPGPYGIAKHPLFVCDCIRGLTKDSSDTKEETGLRKSLPKHFEPPPKNVKVGIEIRGLRKVYGRVRKEVAVDNVDLDIYKGEIMVLLGHNGAGKTTTMSMITGMFSATGGTIKVEGKLLQKNLSNFRGSLGLCTQHDLFFPKLTVINHLVFFGVLRGMSFSQAKRDGMKLLYMLNIPSKANNLGRQLSGGMKRRLCLANSLVGDPQVLVLDEPTSGLDPETRRVIWNLLLGFRGSRTILITTHFMEEADVLGDRIAIMDHGRVICCGSSLFLKKIYGSGYNVHVLKKENAEKSKIFSLIENIVPDPKMRVVSPTQVDFVIKDTYVNKFPSLFTDLERSSNSLGITGISVTSASLEEVFLKVAETSETNQKEKNSTIHISHDFEVEEGSALCKQRLQAVAIKRLTHMKRKWFSYLVRLVISCLLILYMVFTTEYKHPVSEPQNPLLLSLDGIYPGGFIPVKAVNNTPLKDAVIRAISQEKAEVQLITDDENINEFIESLSKKDFLAFLNKALIGITVSSEELVVQYQQMMNIHIPAIAANLIPHILMQSQNIDGKITVVNHPYVLIGQMPECPPTLSSQLEYVTLKASVWMWSIFLAMIICLPGYTYLISEELSTAFKHQQMLAGLSFSLYWFSNFVFDVIFYLFTVSIWIFIIVLVGSQHILIENSELTFLMILVLLLSSFSSVSFLYFLTYIIRGGKAEMITMVLNVIILVVAISIYVQLDTSEFYIILLLFCVCSLNPTFATAMSVTFIVEVILKNHICRVCKYPPTCKVPHTLMDMPMEKDRRSILIFVIFLATLWIPYLFLVLLMDSNLYRKIFSRFCHSVGSPVFRADEDDDVKKEFDLVQSISEGDVSAPLLVENLTKKYLCGPKAVNGVSFLVERGECFGLLGVNGAGKTTTFKVLTGEILPSSGDAEIENVSIFNRGEYLKLIGYCPQVDSCLKVLTGRETLRIIALIRGVPRTEVKRVIDNWLEVMGITEHGNKKTAAYSGGTRRKLCTAMALMGEPTVVLLDEPTTGVDPVSRRKLWSVIQSRQKAGQALVLTSHSMEECEALCTRLTIMRDGRMRCIGTVEYLKNKFRLGFVVEVKLLDCTPEQRDRFKRDFAKVFPRAQLVDENVGMMQFTVLDADRPLSNTFAEMLSLKQQHSSVQDFVVNNTTLEQLFLSFAQT